MKLIKDIYIELVDSYRFRYVVLNFVRSNLKVRYQKTILGFFWSVLGPMLHYLVIGLVFSYTVNGSIKNYLPFMFAGALYYNVISGVVLRAPSILVANEHFIKKIYIPKLIFVLDSVLAELVNFFLGMCALLVLGVIFNRVNLSYHYFFIFYTLFLAIALTLGIGSILSVLGVYYRDLIHIVPVLMQALFFLTPILYKIDLVPENLQFLIKLNPLYYFIEIFRDPIIYNVWPNPYFVLICTILSLCSFFIGLLFLKKFENKVVFSL